MFDEIQLPADFAAVAEDQLTELENQARTAAEPLTTKVRNGDNLTDPELAGLEKLSSVVQGVRAERERRVNEAASQAATAQRQADALATFAEDTKPEGETKPEDDKPAEGKPAAKPRVADLAAGTNGNKAAVTAATDDAAPRSKMVAAPNLVAATAGQQFHNIRELAAAIDAQMGTYSSLGDGHYVRTPVMFVQRNLPEDRVITDKMDRDTILDIIDKAGTESRLGEGGLVAAAGWCAPSEIDYGLFELETDDGLVDVPQVQVRRGGIQFTTGPDFSSIFSGTGYWHQTEAQVQAATSKPCMVIPCPSFTEVRLEVEGVCITGSFLQDRGYPEMVARFTRGAMMAHVHKLNVFIINKMVAGSTLFDYTNVANLPVTTTESKDLTVISRLLALIGIQAMDYRYKYRMGKTATLECILPYWVVESVQADVQRRMGLDRDDAFQVALSQIEGWFAARFIRVQWVYDWLDTYNTTNTSTVGQSAGVYTLPTTVEALLYAAGTWVKGVADVIRLDTVYDSTNLAVNQYTQLFTEEGIMVMKRGFESRRIKTTIDPSGTLSASTDMRTG